MTQPVRKKLIEVALPLEAINGGCQQEKNPFLKGHPRSLHLWWARRPLAAARAVLFASLVDDPVSLPDEFPAETDQDTERQRLFRLIEELVKWGNTTNEKVLQQARDEILKSWSRWCRHSGEDPQKVPHFFDPFAGGGAIPMEAQRLGLEAYASDLNPVAVTINKSMIEIPWLFARKPPVNPSSQQKIAADADRKGAAGLAEDVRYYSEWMRKEAQKRIGHLYPQVPLDSGARVTVIAWLWARTVESPNPAYRGCQVPLVSSYWLSAKTGQEAWIEPVVDGKRYNFNVRTGKPEAKAQIDAGTKFGRGANFSCILSGTPISPVYIRSEAQAGRMGARLMAIVAEGDRGRLYLDPTQEHEDLAKKAMPTWKPDQKVPTPCHDVDRLPMYGMYTWGDAFSSRQLLAMTTYADLVAEARDQIYNDALRAGMSNDMTPLHAGGNAARAYSEAVSVYLAFAINHLSRYSCTICTWNSTNQNVAQAFGRQAIQMVWDYAESNVIHGVLDLHSVAEWVAAAVDKLPAGVNGKCKQGDAAQFVSSERMIICTDPPYYDNIGYADLSDFFYVWLRRSLKPVFPDLFSTMLVPKAEELIASPSRHGSKEKAEKFFMDGMSRAIHNLAMAAHPAFPVTIYYAFKQSESDHRGTASTGWETFLEAVIQTGFSLTGTWPIRTERERGLKSAVNALASSIVLVCRPRPADALVTTRRDFLATLKREMPPALRALQQGNVAPVDLAQASIGPGMAIFSCYAKILETDGSAMKVRTALTLINQTLDDVLAEQEGDFDADTGWAVAWFDQFAFNDGSFGEAETLCKAKNTSVSGLQRAGIVKAGAGKVCLLRVDELPVTWDPISDNRFTIWEATHHLIRALKDSETSAATLLARIGGEAETARELSYRLYNICERRKRAQEAQDYNALVQSWPEIARLAREVKQPTTIKEGLF